MRNLKTEPDVIVYIQSLLNEKLILPYNNVAILLKMHNYPVSSIQFIKPEKKEQRLTISSIQETIQGVQLTIFEESWVNYLPNIYKNKTLEDFLYGFQLSMFKQLEIVDHIEELFIPEKAPHEFVDWLASWYNIAFSNKIKLKNKKQIIYKLTELYNIKGTKKYLIDMIYFLTDISISIKERKIVNEFSMVDKDVSFVVSIQTEPKYKNANERDLIQQIVKNIIENEKPIFTNALFDGSFITSKDQHLISTPIIKENETIYTDKESDINKEEPQENKKSDYDDFF
ncbi:MAG TPA: hypothetical protein EYG73_02170 [Arcobacter sp.]|nr:hypothetical protein [Arcobacter sp.]